MGRRKVKRQTRAVDIGASWTIARPDLSPLHYVPHIYLIRIGSVLERLDEQQNLQSFGIHALEMRMLLALRRSGPPYARRSSDLFRALLISSGTVTKQVKRLTELGFLRRAPDPQAPGRFLVQLTDKGIAAADRAVEYGAREGIMSPAASSLSEEERATLMTLCEKMLTDMELYLDREN
jgi:DNA-binding MarR family transcriptional regulator